MSMSIHTPRVEAIKTALDDKYKVWSLPFSIVQTVAWLMKVFVLTSEEMEDVVLITKSKLEEVLSTQWNKCSSIMWTLELYKNENDRTKLVVFSADHQKKEIRLVSWESLDSALDYESLRQMNERLENTRRIPHYQPDNTRYTAAA